MKAVGCFFPKEETLTTASAKTPSIKVYRMAKDRAVGILRARAFHEGETVIPDSQHLIVGEVKRLTCPTLTRFSSCVRLGQVWLVKLPPFSGHRLRLTTCAVQIPQG